MNRIYQSVWNGKTDTFVAVSEINTNAGRKSSPGASARAGTVAANTRFALKAVAISVMVAFGANAYALPAGGVVAQGGASISNAPGSTTITQSSQNVAINWQSFSIGAAEAVRFLQPNSSSVALNRVLGPDPSSILGSMSANGKVFLVNPNGVLFGRGSQVNVGGLVASTLNISDSDFMAGNYRFSGNSDAAVVNQGTINAPGGYVALLGANVGNDGTILARLGTVALAAGSAMTLDVAGDGLLNVTVSQGAVNALVQNGGLIQADGGNVLLTAMAAGMLLQSAVNNTGVIQAQTIENHNGTIRLMGDMQIGTTNVGGRLDASAPNGGDGGFIETSAAHVKIAAGTIIDAQSAQGKAGTWLIDPFDFTIATLGGDLTPGDLATALLAADVTISSNDGLVSGSGGLGDINVNNAVTWISARTLTLNAVNDVNFNAAVTATNGGSLVATAGNDINVAIGVTGITTTGGNITWTAGNDIWVKSGMATGVTATFAAGNSGNITWVAGNDVKIDLAAVGPTVTATGGDFTVCCGRDINVNGGVTTTDGGVSLRAGRDLVIAAAMTTTRGDVVLSAGPDATGVGGPLGGTVEFGAGVLYTVTGAVGTPVAVTVDYTPDSYGDALRNYSGNFILTDAALTSHMLVFPQGNDKVYDGNTTATLSFRGDPTLGGAVTLIPGTGTFDDPNVAANIGITYTGYSLGGANASKFALWTDCGAVAGSGRTSAAITLRPMTLQANDDSKVYGQNFTPASTAFTIPVPPIPGETVTAVAETSTGSARTASVAGSTYPILITPGSATGSFTPSNYTITYLPGALTVRRAPLTVTANDNTKVYGQTFTPASTAFTTTALRNGETVGSVTEVSPAGTPATAAVPGPYAITPSDATGGTFTPSNYTITYVDGALTVTPAPLTVRANDNTKVFGTTFTPASTAFTTTALQNGETVGSVTEVSPAGTPPTAAVPGPYAITPSAATGGTFTPSNYTITYVDGALTVTAVVAPIEPPVIVPPIPPVIPPVEPVVPILPVDVADVDVAGVDVTPEEMLGPHGSTTSATLQRGASLMPSVVLAGLPPQLLSIAPIPVPVIVPPPAPVIQEAPPLYVPPVRPLKQDRN